MRVRQVIEAGPVKSFYVSSWDDIELEFQCEHGEVKLTISEIVMSQVHKQLGDKLTSLAEKRLKEAREMVESTQEDYDE